MAKSKYSKETKMAVVLERFRKGIDDLNRIW
jgi:hypothetical protein